MSGSGIPPWHMWGSSPTVQLVSTPVGGSVDVPQLVQVDYKRPENWQFLLGLTLAGLVGVPATALTCRFILNIGLGRARVNIARFCDINITAAQMTAAQQNAIFVTQTAPDPIGAGPGLPTTSFPAESIAISANAFWNGNPGANIVATLQVTAFVAPSTHLRPEWYLGKFPGGETGGT